MKSRFTIAAFIISFIIVSSSATMAAVSTTTARVQYSCNGTTTAYTYPFQINADSEILAIVASSAGAETTLVLNTDYTVSGEGSSTGGTLTLTAGSTCGSGYTLTLLRNTPLTQATDYTDGDAFSAESFEDALDKQTLIQQQHNEAISRAIKVPKSSTLTGSAVEVTPAAGRAIGFNSAATGLTTYATTATTTTDFDNLTSYSSSLNTAATAIGSGEQTVVCNTACTMSGNLSLPATFHLQVQKGCAINTGGYTLAFGSQPTVNNGDGQWITGASVGSVTGLTLAKPEWFGTGTTAFQSAVNAVAPTLAANPWDPAATKYAGVVLLSPGTYAVSSTVTIPSYVRLQGAGRLQTKIISSITDGTAALSFGTLATPAYHVSGEGFSVEGQSKDATGIAVYAAANWDLRDISVNSFNRHGYYFYDAYDGFGYNLNAKYCATSAGYAGIYLDGQGAGWGENATNFIGGNIEGCYDNVVVKVGSKISFIGMSFQSASRHGIYLNGTNQDSTSIRDCYFEANAASVAGSSIMGSFLRTIIDGNYFSPGTNEDKCIQIHSANGMTVINNTIPVMTAPKAFIGQDDESVLPAAFTFMRTVVYGNKGADDSTLLYTANLQTCIDAKETAAPTSLDTNYLVHRGKYDSIAQFKRPMLIANTVYFPIVSGSGFSSTDYIKVSVNTTTGVITGTVYASGVAGATGTLAWGGNASTSGVGAAYGRVPITTSAGVKYIQLYDAP